MLYQGTFSTHREAQYKVEIGSANDGKTPKELLFSSEPCTISGDSDGIFSPIKSKSAVINIVLDNGVEAYDLYSPTSQGIPVKITKLRNTRRQAVNKAVFCGYITPCMYTQSWEYVSELEVECVDRLSSLKDFKYELYNPSEGFQMLSFTTLLKNTLMKAGYGREGGSTSRFWFPISSMIPLSSSMHILDYTRVSESNFFDDDDEATPWTYEDLLTEICNYMGWSCVPDGDDVWFVDYQCVAKATDSNELNVYRGVSIRGTEEDITKTISDKVLSLADQRGGTPDISMDEVYNKIEVSASIYELASGSDGELETDIYNENQLWNDVAYGYSGVGFVYSIDPRTLIQNGDNIIPYEAHIKFFHPRESSKWQCLYNESNIVMGMMNDEDMGPWYTYQYGGRSSSGRHKKKTTYNPPYRSQGTNNNGYDIEDYFWGGMQLEQNVHRYEGIYDNTLYAFNYRNPIPAAIMKNTAVITKYQVFKRNDVPVSLDWNNCIMFNPVNRGLGKVVRDFILKRYSSEYGTPTYTEMTKHTWRSNSSSWDSDYCKFDWQNIYYDPSPYDIVNLATELNGALFNDIIAENIKPCLKFEDNVDLVWSKKNKTCYLTFDFALLYQQDHIYTKDKTVHPSCVWFQRENGSTGNKHLNSIIPLNEYGYTDDQPIGIRNRGDYGFNQGWNALKLEVKIGNKWWNGNYWGPSRDTFEIAVHDGKADPNKADSQEKLSLYKWLQPVYNTSYVDQIGKSLYAIPITQEDKLNGKLSIVIYTPRMLVGTPPFSSSRSQYSAAIYFDYTVFPQHIFMKDFTVGYFSPVGDLNDSTGEDKDEDIMYTNIINESYVKEMDDLELKINTEVDDQPNSKSYVSNSSGEHFTTVQCPATWSNHRPEEHLVEKYYNHYSQPKKNIEINLSRENDDVCPATRYKYQAITSLAMICDTMEENLVEDCAITKLIEF